MHDDDDDWHRALPPDRPPLPGEPTSNPTPNGSGNGRRSGRADRGRSGPPTPPRRHLTGPTPVPFRGVRIEGDSPTIPWLKRAVTQSLPRFGPALAFLIIPPLLTSARYWAGLGLAPGAIWRAGTIIRPVGLILLAIDLILSGVTIAAAHHLILGSHLGLTSGPGRSAGRVLGRLPAVLAATVPWSVAVVVARTAASSRNDSALVVTPLSIFQRTGKRGEKSGENLT